MADCFVSKKYDGDWFVIMDGSDNPYIVHEDEIDECIGELREGIVDSVCQDLQDSISNDKSINSMVNAVVREYKGHKWLKDAEYWIIVYQLDGNIIHKYNECAKSYNLPVIDDEQTEEQIREAIMVRHSLGLTRFLEKEKREYKSYYTPALALGNGVNDDLVERLIEILK
jgi:hypothetical protein